MKPLLSLAVIVSYLLAGTQRGLSQVWIQTSAPETNWVGIVSSVDGTKLAAIVEDGPIYTSSDSGATWGVSDAPVESWTSIASSADGSRLAAAVWSGPIYLSTNYGSSWQSGAPDGEWESIACSSDGSVLVAASLSYEWGELTTGPLCISTNAGTSWTVADLPDQLWNSVSCSCDGTKIVAAAPQFMFTSTNFGLTWAKGTMPDEAWTHVASSSDGNKLLAVSMGHDGYEQTVNIFTGGIYSSTNSGATWMETSLPEGIWQSVACSTNGNVLVAAGEDFSPASFLWITTDSGATWASNKQPDAGVTLASSGDGSQLMAAFDYGGIFVWRWRPTLTIISSNQQVVISWPASGIETVLQHSPDLNTPQWSDVSIAPTVSNGTNQVVMPLCFGGNFYRLKVP